MTTHIILTVVAKKSREPIADFPSHPNPNKTDSPVDMDSLNIFTTAQHSHEGRATGRSPR
jgi:hypothetical protein